jgi:hypothetical protein
VASLHSDTALLSRALEFDDAVGAGAEAAQSGKGGGFAAAQFAKNVVDHAIQTVGGFGFGDSGLAGHVSCDFRLLHAGFNLTGGFEHSSLADWLKMGKLLL